MNSCLFCCLCYLANQTSLIRREPSCDHSISIKLNRIGSNRITGFEIKFIGVMFIHFVDILHQSLLTSHCVFGPNERPSSLRSPRGPVASNWIKLNRIGSNYIEQSHRGARIFSDWCLFLSWKYFCMIFNSKSIKICNRFTSNIDKKNLVNTFSFLSKLTFW